MQQRKKIKVVLLISGKRWSGKDTLAKILNDKFQSYGGVITSFGDIMKQDYCDSEENVCLNDLKDRIIKERHRKKMIKFAEEKKEKSGMDYWARRCWEKNQMYNLLIISDWRFCQEYIFFQELLKKNIIQKLICVRIDTSMEQKINRGWKYNKDIDEHQGEIELDTFEAFDYVINNDGTKQKLSKLVKDIKICVNK